MLDEPPSTSSSPHEVTLLAEILESSCSESLEEGKDGAVVESFRELRWCMYMCVARYPCHFIFQAKKGSTSNNEVCVCEYVCAAVLV